MARIPRRELIDPTEVGVYHCVQRAVRRAWLCGQDPVTGQNFDHRKGWIQDRLEFLAGQFAIDICSIAIMSNHVHLVVRNRPDIVQDWTALEVARRWWNLFPCRKNEDGSPAEPEPHELDMLIADTPTLEERRQRLSSISWLMRCLAEPIARRANREDGCTGRFWEGRYKCQRLLDEAAVLACSVYVDLNPVRAGVTQTPETSEFTSAYERIMAKRDESVASNDQVVDSEQIGDLKRPRDAWLSPLELDSETRQEQQKPVGRASDKGFLPLNLEQYLTLLDWTGRQARRDGQGCIPAELSPILERVQLSPDMWVDTVWNFGRWFHRAVGRVDSLAAEATRRGRRWLQGISHSRAAFA